MKHLAKSAAVRLALAAAALLAGCSAGWDRDAGPPHPGAPNPYSNGGFHDPGPEYPATGP